MSITSTGRSQGGLPTKDALLVFLSTKTGLCDHRKEGHLVVGIGAGFQHEFVTDVDGLHIGASPVIFTR